MYKNIIILTIFIIMQFQKNDVVREYVIFKWKKT